MSEKIEAVALELRRLRHTADRLDLHHASGLAENVREAADKLESAIDTLRAEVEALRADAANLEDRCTMLHGSAEYMRAHAEKAEEDAERYRWLRSQTNPVPFVCERRILVSIHDWGKNLDPDNRFNMWSSMQVERDALDAAIDAARQEEA